MYAQNMERKEQLPVGAEGYLQIPQWQMCTENYQDAVLKAFSELSRVREFSFLNLRSGGISPGSFRESEKSRILRSGLALEPSWYLPLMVPAQSGLRYKGQSASRVREGMKGNEFCLGVFVVAYMLLTEPTLLACKEDLWIDCAGDEYHDEDHSVKPFDHVPFFCFRNGGLKFGVRWCEAESPLAGSATAWVVPGPSP